ncbi:MAG TPA: helix-turn-helix domain-containing protein [Pyrinomonadaceae bacterium]|jgi:DNA-binding NtrC family response regulator
MSLSILDFDLRSAQGGTGDSQPSDDALNNRIEALKTLALNLLRELEALEQSRADDRGAKLSLHEEVRRFEEDMIRCALIRTGGRQRRAARMLGMSAATLNAKIKRYGISPDALVSGASGLLSAK